MSGASGWSANSFSHFPAACCSAGAPLGQLHYESIGQVSYFELMGATLRSECSSRCSSLTCTRR